MARAIVAQLLFAMMALLYHTAAQACGGMRQPACLDDDNNPFCTFEPAGINGGGRCVPCGNSGRPLCLGPPLTLPLALLVTTSPLQGLPL